MLRSFRNQVEEVKGLGDLVELATAATGIKSVVDKVSEATGKDCGCGKRKNWLNDNIPFRRREGEH